MKSVSVYWISRKLPTISIDDSDSDSKLKRVSQLHAPLLVSFQVPAVKDGSCNDSCASGDEIKHPSPLLTYCT
ncbi:uncharacterized [Tachysurus ichikawai]